MGMPPLLIATLLALASLQAPQADIGALEGVVMRANSTQPIEGARVAIWGDKGPDLETRTDPNGRYLFPALPYGSYNMEVQAEGYLSSPSPLTNLKIRLTIDSVERVRRDVSLAVVAAIRGRILDDKREPLSSYGVEIVQLIQDSFGRPYWRSVANVRTDTNGEFRIEGLSPADYYVRASSRISISSGDMATTYFPGTSDPRSAAVVSLREGGEASAVFSMGTEKTYSVAGAITQDSNPAVPSLMLYTVPQDSRVPIDEGYTSGVSVQPSAQGVWNFELRGLLPGVYDVFAVAGPARTFSTTFDPNSGLSQVVIGAEVPGRVATTTVEIRDENVKDIRLSLEPGVNVVGRLRLVDNTGKPLTLAAKGGASNPIEITSDSTTTRFVLRLNRREEFIAGLLNLRPVVKEGENLFAFTGVPAGTYDIALDEEGADGDFYLADVRESARSVFDEGLRVRSEPIDFLEVVIGFDGGVVEGAVAGNGESRVLVVLAPHPSRRQNGTLFKTAELSDSTDLFRFTGVAPGLYSIFAFEIPESAETVPYRNKDFLSLHETEGRAVTVGKGATVGPVQVPLIPR